MSRLGLGLGITKGGVIPFNPLSLNPYLLFDTQSSMIGTFENPTLDLDPSVPSTLDVITASRGGVATYTDAAGVIQSADPDTTRVDHVQGEELTPTKFQNIGYTDFTSSLWVKSNATVTFNQETAPDGTQTAAKYFGSGTGQDLYYNSTFTGPFTYSLFVKYINAPYIRLRNDSVSTWFNLTSGSVATQNHDSASIEDVGDGWFRISVTVSSASSLLRAFIHPHATDNTTFEQDGGSFYLWGPQLEEGTTASSFVANTSGSPKFISSAVYGPRVPMILVEPSATNLVTYSEDFSHSSWNTASASVTVDYGYLSPSGDLTASKVTKQTTNGHLYSGQATGAKSIFIKGTAGETVATLDRFTDANTLITLTGEWQRVELNGVNVNFYAVDFRAGTATEVYIWGAQLETGSVATSYIPTSGGDAAARTRASDELVISGSDFSGFFNGSAGTFFIQAQNRTPEDNGAVLMGQNNNKLFFYKSNPNRLSTYDGGSFTHHDGLVANQLFNAAVTFNTSNRSSSLDGSALDTDTINTQWAGADILKIGFGYSNNFNGHYRRILFWPYHSDNL